MKYRNTTETRRAISILLAQLDADLSTGDKGYPTVSIDESMAFFQRQLQQLTVANEVKMLTAELTRAVLSGNPHDTSRVIGKLYEVSDSIAESKGIIVAVE